MLKQEADVGLVNVIKDGVRVVAVFDDQVKVDVERLPASLAGEGFDGLADDLWAVRGVQEGDPLPLAVLQQPSRAKGRPAVRDNLFSNLAASSRGLAARRRSRRQADLGCAAANRR